MSDPHSVTKQIVVEASREHCFRVFTDGLDRWWPRQHHIGKSPLAKAVLEPRVGGRWYAVCEDGTECDTGKVLEWQPPLKLVLAWQITAAWQYDAAFLTEIEVTFTAEAPKRTRVDLVHRNLDRYGVAEGEITSMLDAEGGWRLIFETFGKTAESPEGATQHYFMRLIGPRPTFPMDITPGERELMGQHAVYTQAHFDAGRIVAYGPVFASGGPFGVAIFAASNEADVRRMMDQDPTILAGLNTYEVSPMMLVAARAV